jgi:Family of unknown function (DUF6188)
MATVIPDLSPSDLLSRLRGMIVDAAPGYPEVIHLDVKDENGAVWGFSTWYAEFSPTDPELLLGKTVVDVDFERSGKLTMRFSDGGEFNVSPEPEEPDDELETWTLLTPDGLALRFRPRGLWDLVPAGTV